MKKILLLIIFTLTACNSDPNVDAAFRVATPSPTVTPKPTQAPIGVLGNSALSISPVNYNFGLVSVGQTSSPLTMVVKNVSDVPIFISSIAPVQANPNFSISSLNCPMGVTPLGAGLSCSANVNFAPLTGGNLQFQITAVFGSKAGDIGLTTQITVSGVGVSQLNFAGLNPIDLTAVTTTTVPLTWTGVSNVNYYAIYKAVTGGTLALDGYSPAGTTSYTVQNLSPGTAYTFQAYAANLLNQQDSNQVTQQANTDSLGSFSVLADLNTSEGGSISSPDLGLNCTDAKGHYPSFMSISSVSDPLAQCVMLTSPYRVRCTPGYKVGLPPWSSTLNISCLLNGYATPYTQTMNVNVAFTDRAPIIAPIGNQAVLAGTAMNPVSPVASDPNNFALTYSCQYSTLLVGGVVPPSALACGTLLNQNGSTASFSSATGAFAWTPSLSLSGTTYYIEITVTDPYGLSANSVFNIAIGEPPPDSSHSVVTILSSTVNSGSTTTVTLTAKDPNGNAIPKGGSTVVFSTSGGTSTGTFSPTTDNGNGTYTATFRGVLSGSATTIQASAQGVPITSALPSVTVNAGPISVATSSINLSSATVVSGSTITATLTAKDAASNLILSGGKTVLFGRTGGSSTGSFSGTTDNGNGTYTALFTGAASGSATTITATINSANVTSTLPTLTVLPGTLSLLQSTLSVAGNATLVSSGSSVNLTLTTRDSNGNALTTGGQTVNLSNSGGSSTGTFSSVADNGDGTYSATFTGVHAGTGTTLSANIGGLGLTSTLPTISVVPGAPSVSQSLLAVGSASVVSGSTTTLTLTTKDSNGNLLTSGGQSNGFSLGSGSSTGTISSVTDNLNGTYTATFTGVIAGSATTIIASISGSPLTSAAQTITVTPGALSLSQSIVTASSPSVASGLSVTVTLQTKDAASNFLAVGGHTVIFNRSGGTSQGTFSGTSYLGNGAYSATFTGTTVGTATGISATVDGTQITSAAVPVSVIPANLSLSNSIVTISSASVVSGFSVTVTLTTKDTSGNPLTSGGSSVAFGNSGGASSGTFSTVIDHGDGSYASTFTATTSGSGTLITATIGGSLVTSSSPTLTVSPGALSLSQSNVTVSASSIASGTNSTLILFTKDSNGNLLGVGGQTVVFSKTGGTSTGIFSSVTDNGDGTYTATFTGVLSGSPISMGASVGGVAVSSALPTITVSPGAISYSNSPISVSNASLLSGQTSTVTLTVKDASGNAMPTGGLSVFFAKSGGSSSGTFGVVTDNSNGTYTAVFTATTAGTATSIVASIGGSSVTSVSPTITVSPGALSLSQSIVSVSSPTVAAGSTVTLTLTAKDLNGNQLTGGGQTVLFNHTGGTSSGTFSSVTDNLNGTYTGTFTATISGTATLITASVGGSAVTSASPTITVGAGSLSLSQSLVSVSSATISSGTTASLTMTAKDANGNSLTTGGATVVFARTIGTSNGTISSTTDNGNGTYSATFTGTAVGTSSISASVGGSALTSSPVNITVIPGVFSAAQSLVTVSSGSVSSGSSITLTMTAKDSSGNPLSAGGLTIVFSRSGGTSNGNFGAVTDNNNGTYTASFTGTTSGTATTINASINGTPVSSALPTVSVTPGAVSLFYSTVTIAGGLSSIASGSSVGLKLTARDANQNQLTTGGLVVNFTALTGTSSGTFTGLSDNNDGTYSVTFTGSTSGTAKNMSATIGGSALTSAAPTLAVTPGGISYTNSVITVSQASIQSGSTSIITLTVKDANNNLLTAGGQTVVLNFSSGAGVSSGTLSAVTDNHNGTYTATFTGTTAGAASTVSGSVAGTSVSSAAPTITVTPGAYSLSQSLITVSSSSVVAGFTSTLTLTAKDANGNQLSSGGLSVLFGTSGAGTSTGAISSTTDLNNGLYTATFTGVTAGSAINVTASMGGSSVTSTPVPTLTVSTGTVSPSKSSVTLSSSVLTAGGTATATIVLKDASSNGIADSSQASNLSFSMLATGSSSGTFGTITAVGGSAGTYQATFTATLAGTVNTIQAALAGNGNFSSNPSITVNAAAVSATQSTVSVSPAAVIANGSATSIVTVTLLDAYNNPISGKIVSLTSNRGVSDTISSASGPSSAIGVVTFSVKSAVKGVSTYTASDTTDSITLSAAPTVTFNAGVPSPTVSTIAGSPSSVTADGTTTSIITITLLDANGNAVSGKTVSLTSSRGSNDTVSSASGASSALGVVSFTVKSIHAGSSTYTAVDTTDTITLSNTASVNYTPGVISQANSTVVASAANVTANGTATSTITVTLLDGNSNALSGKTVTLASSRGASDTITPVSGTTNALGLASFTVKSSVSGVSTYTATDSSDTVVLTNTTNVSFNAGAMSTATSTVLASPTAQIANGTTTSTITVTLLDANSNAISGKTVTLSSSRGGSDTISTASGTSSASGVVTFSVKSSVAGTATYTATDATDSITLTSTASIVFSAGTPASIAVNFGNNQSGTAGSPLAGAPQVLVTDAQGNPVSNQTINWSVLAGAGSVVGTTTSSTSTTNSSGLASSTWTLGTTAGSNTLQAQVNGTALSATFTSTGTAGAVTKIGFIQNPSNTVAATAISPSVTVAAQDVNGNTVSTYVTAFSIALTANPGASTLSGTLSAAPSSGVASFSTLSLNNIGTGYTLTATSGAYAATSSAFNITYHPEALTWQTNVISNGGTVSASTLLAVSNFCVNLNSNGLRSLIYRMNLFAGTGLASALTPLFTGPVDGGAVYGNLSDANANFISNDYNESGLTGGLQCNWNARSTFLDTGLTSGTGSLSANNNHLMAYIQSPRYLPGQSNRGVIGSGSQSAGVDDWSMVENIDVWMNFYSPAAAGLSSSLSASSNDAGSWISTRAGSNVAIFKNGSSIASSTSGNATAINALSVQVCGIRSNGASSATAPTYGSNDRLGAYSIGLGLTSLQAANLSTALETFEQAMKRGVQYSSGNAVTSTVGTIELNSSWTPQWNSILSYWKMNNDWTDSVGTQNGTSFGASFVTGKIGSNAGSFNGTSYVTASNASLPVGNANRTVAFWLKTTQTSSAGVFPAIFEYGTQVTNQDFFLALTPPGYTGAAGTVIYSAWGNDIENSTVVNDGNWHHIALTYDGTNYKFYHNGALERTKGLTTNTVRGSNSHFSIASGTASNPPLNGSLDDFAIWSRDLTATEVQTIYNTQSAAYNTSSMVNPSLPSYALSGTCTTNGSTVNIIATDGTNTVTGSTTCSSGTWSLVINTSTLTAGNITFAPSDGNGNINSASANTQAIASATITPSGSGQTGYDNYTLPTPYQVTVTDSNGRPMSGATINWSTASGTLSSATSTTNASGVAQTTFTFGHSPGAAVTTASLVGTSVTASFTSTSTYGAVTQIGFVQNPSNSVAGMSISPAVTVVAKDSAGNVVPTYSTAITIAVGTNPGSSTLSGTLTATPASGIATFSNLSLNNIGSGYTLGATSGLYVATSTAFNITYHPEALTWQTNVTSNGGSVTASTLLAVSNFCVSLNINGIRSSIYRMNLFAGTGLNAALTPLFRGPAAGTNYGNATDTNTNFVSGDYVETGATGGLQCNFTARATYLDTGLASGTGSVTANNNHLMTYVQNERFLTGQTIRGLIGSGSQTSGTDDWSILENSSGNLNYFSPAAATVSTVFNFNNTDAGSYISTRSSNNLAIYKNGASVSTATSASAIALNTFSVQVCGTRINGASSAAAPTYGSNDRLGAYSIGLGLTSLQAANLSTALETFEQAMKRGVNYSSGNAVTGVGYSPELNSGWTPSYSSLVGYWKLNGTLGSIANSSSVLDTLTTSSGTVFGGGLTYATGKLNQAMKFDKTSTVSVPYTSIANTCGPISISFWTNWNAPNTSNYAMMATNMNGCSAPGWGIGQNSTVKTLHMCLWTTGGNSQCLNSIGTPLDGSWHYITFTATAGGTGSIYIDGTLDSSKAFNMGAGVCNSTANISLGNGGCIAGNYFDGMLDDFAIWNTALSSGQVQTIYNTQNGTYNNSLVNTSFPYANLSGTCTTNGSTVNIIATDGTNTVTGSTTCTSGTWSLVINTSTLTAGNITFAPSDGNGNITVSGSGGQTLSSPSIVTSGSGQTGYTYNALASPFQVTVTDSNGRAISGATITYVVTSGSGTLSTGSTTTNASGVAQSTLTFGSTPGAVSVTASIVGSAVTATFTATSSTQAFTQNWATTSVNSSSYSLSSNSLDFNGSSNSCELAPASQTDNSNSALGFAGGTLSGLAYGTLSDGTSSGLKLASDGSCNGSGTNCSAELDSSWAPQWSSVVAYWKFNETAGAISVADSKGSYTGTPTNITFGSTGKLNKAATTGSTSLITVPSFSLSGSSFTASVWFNTTSTSGYSQILSFTGINLLHLSRDNSHIRLCISGQCNLGTTTVINDGKWHYLVVVGDATSVRAYVDGSSTPEVTNVASAQTLTAPFICAGGGFYYSGLLDEIAVWNTSLTMAEISRIYNRQAPTYSGSFTSRVMDAYQTGQSWTSLSWIPTLPFFKALPDYSGGAVQNESSTSYSSLQGDTPATGDNNLMTGIVGLWHLDSNAIDSSGQGNNGTSTSMTFGATGKFNTAASFNGSNGYILLKTGSLIASQSAGAISMWVSSPTTSLSGEQSLYDESTAGGTVWRMRRNNNTVTFGPASSSVASGNITWGSGIWHHLVGTWTTSSTNLYIDGLLASSNSMSGVNTGGSIANSWLGRYGQGYYFNGFIDEVAIWSKALNQTEVTQLYQRGASRLKFQVRSCSDNTCTSGAPVWQGPDGTANTYFSELNNMSVQTVTPSGTVNAALPNMTLQNYTSPVGTNRYFQYRTIFESDSSTAALMPELKSVTLGPNHYDTSNPTVMSKTGVAYYSLSNAVQTLGSNGCTSGVLYNLGVGAAYSSATWYWYNGTTWVTAGGTTATANTASALASNVSTFASVAGAGNTVYFKAFLQSTGASACELQNFQLIGTQ